MLDGYIDIYLPDFKYFDNKLGIRLSNVSNYRETAIDSIKEMKYQVGENVYNEDGILQKGIIIRHLVLPNNISNSKAVLTWIKREMPETTISLMAQYFPTYKAKEIEEFLYKLNLENGYIQSLEDEEEKYVPEF